MTTCAKRPHIPNVFVLVLDTYIGEWLASIIIDSNGIKQPIQMVLELWYQPNILYLVGNSRWMFFLFFLNSNFFVNLTPKLLFGSIGTIVKHIDTRMILLRYNFLPWQGRRNLCQHSKNRDAYLSGMWLDVDLRTNTKKTLSWGY